MDMPKMGRFGLRKVTLLTVVAMSRTSPSPAVARIVTLLSRRERRIVEYMVAAPAERRKMKLPAKLKGAAETLIAWAEGNRRTSTPAPT